MSRFGVSRAAWGSLAAATLGACALSAAAAPAAPAAAAPGHNDTGTVPPRGVAQRAPAASVRASRVYTARSATLGPRVLGVGAGGEDVAALQDWLSRRGHRVPSTGYFGPVTQRQVKAFQRTKKLTADGVVGPKTYFALGLHDPLRSYGIRRVRASGGWLAAIPGTGGIRADRRIVRDIEELIVYYDLRITAAYAAGGHATRGEHPMGLAIDAVPADGNWSRAMQLAHDMGWNARCAANGTNPTCAYAPYRFIEYNGYPGGGDPAHAGYNAHIHLSWLHTPTRYNHRAWRIKVFRAP